MIVHVVEDGWDGMCWWVVLVDDRWWLLAVVVQVASANSNVGGGDGCTPGTSIGIENIAIHVQGNWAKGFQVNGSSQGACNQAFNLLGSSFGSPAFPSESRIR